MGRWWLLFGFLLLLGLDSGLTQTQPDVPQITGNLYYRRGVGLEREYLLVSQDGREVITEYTNVGSVEYPDYLRPAPPLPDLMPNLYQYPHGFHLKSPTFPYYVYVPCPQEEISYYYSDELREKFAFCREEHLVVYDAGTNEEISRLDNDQVARFAGISVFYLFAWSPSGQYLAYPPMGCGSLPQDGCPRVRIFDVISRHYVDTSVTTRANIEFVRGDLNWSPDERYIGFSDIGSTAIVGSHLNILEISSNSIILSIPVLEGSPSWAWSPTSQSIAIIKPNNRLVLLNIHDGSSQLLDTNVTYLIAWTE